MPHRRLKPGARDKLTYFARRFVQAITSHHLTCCEKQSFFRKRELMIALYKAQSLAVPALRQDHLVLSVKYDDKGKYFSLTV